MVNLILFSLIYYIVFFIVSFSCNVSAIGTSIADAAFPESTIENIRDRPSIAFAVLVPLDDDGSHGEHHKSKRCWKARPFRKMKLSCDPNDTIYRTTAESGGRMRYNRKKVGASNDLEKEELPTIVPYVKIDDDLYGDEKRSVEESEETWNSNESMEDNSGEKFPRLRVAAIKNPRKNLQGFFRTEKKSQEKIASSEQSDENGADLILKKIKNHLNSNEYNVLALVGKRADHSSAKKSKKYFCYCSEPNCSGRNCQRIIYKPCSTRKYSRPVFCDRGNNCRPNNVNAHYKNEESQSADERVRLNVQYPYPKNHYSEYSMSNNVPSSNNPRASSPLEEPQQTDGISQTDYITPPAFIDGRNRQFFYGSPGRIVHVNQNNNIKTNTGQYRIFNVPEFSENSGSSNQYSVTQQKPAIENVYPVTLGQSNNINNHYLPHSQWSVKSLHPHNGKTGSTMPLTNHWIIGSHKQPGQSNYLGSMKPEVANLHPISNYAYGSNGEFVRNSYHGSDGFSHWNGLNKMRSQTDPQQNDHQASFQGMKPSIEYSENDQGFPESTSISNEDSTSFEEPAVLDGEKNHSVKDGREMDNRPNFEYGGFVVSTEDNVGGKKSSEINGGNHSDEFPDSKLEDLSHQEEDFELGNEHTQIDIDDSKSTESTITTVPLISNENFERGEHPRYSDRVGDSLKEYPSFEDENDEAQYMSLSSESISHSNSDELPDNLSGHELLGSQKMDEEMGTKHSIQDHNESHCIDKTGLRTQIERPTEVKPTWNRYGNYERADPVIQPENNYGYNNMGKNEIFSYNLNYNGPRFGQHPGLVLPRDENHGSLHHFANQETPEFENNQNLARSQPKYPGMENSDRVFVSDSDTTGHAISTDDDYSGIEKVRNEYFTSQTHGGVGDMSSKNIGVIETESTHPELVGKSSSDTDTLNDSMEYDARGRISGYEKWFNTSKESDLENDNLSVSADETQSSNDYSDESSEVQSHKVSEYSDAVLTDSGEQMTEHGYEYGKSDTALEKIIDENQAFGFQKENNGIHEGLKSHDVTTSSDSQRKSEKSKSAEESWSEILENRRVKSEKELETIDAKDDYKLDSPMENQASDSNEEAIEEDNDERTKEENNKLIPAEVLKQENAASIEDKSDRVVTEDDAAEVEAEKHSGQGSIGSYKDYDHSKSEEYDESVYSTVGDNPTLSNYENLEKVGVVKTEYDIPSYPAQIAHEPEIPIEDSPTRYFSPNDRVLEYIKKHSADLVASKDLTGTECREQHIPPVLYHTKQSESGPDNDEMYKNLSESEDYWYDDQTEISDTNNDRKNVNTETSHEFLEEDYSSGRERIADGQTFVGSEKINQDKYDKPVEYVGHEAEETVYEGPEDKESNREHPELGSSLSHLIHLTEAPQKDSKEFGDYKDYDNSASISESDVSKNVGMYERTGNQREEFHSSEEDESEVTILEHKKDNSAHDELTHSNQGTLGLIQKPQMDLVASNKKSMTKSDSVEVPGLIYHRGNPEYEKSETSTEYPETSDSIESDEQEYETPLSRIEDFKWSKKSAESAKMSEELIATTQGHNSVEFIERPSNYNEKEIIHLQKELAPHNYDYSESSEDLNSSKESAESMTDRITENVSHSKYILHDDRGKAAPIIGKTSPCGCSAAGRKVTTEDEKNGKSIDFLSTSHNDNEEDTVESKHRKDYDSTEETTSAIEADIEQSQDVSSSEYAETVSDESLSPEFDKQVSGVNSDQYIGIKDPATQSTIESTLPDIKMDKDGEELQYSIGSEEGRYIKLSHKHEDDGEEDAYLEENLSRTDESTSQEDKMENIRKGQVHQIMHGMQEDWHASTHSNTRDESLASIEGESNEKSDIFSSEVKSAEFVGFPRSHQGSCTKPPEVENDFGYLGRLAPTKPNAEDKSLGNLVNSDLYYIGDGVRLPLSIKKLKDGSFALSISDKICEQRMAEKCPCCVPREGRILQEKKMSEFNADEQLRKIDSKASTNDSEPGTDEEEIEGFQALNHNQHQPRRNERALNVENESKHHRRVTRSITMPVNEFIEKYNLNLNLDDLQQEGKLTVVESHFEHNVIRGNETTGEVLEKHNSSLAQELASINEPAQNISRNALLTTLNGFIQTDPKDIHVVIDEIEKELSDVNGKEKSEESFPEKEIFGNNKNDNHYEYQKGNLILERIAIIKKLQDDKQRCEHRYQKDCLDAITQKTELLTTILYWLKNLLLAEDQKN